MLIKADNLHKKYMLKKHEVRVLSGAGLEVKKGETIAVVGRSGAGKSTLLHILGGIDKPDPGSGSVIVDGIDLYNVSATSRTRTRSKSIGFVFQSYHLLNEMNVLENVILPAMAVGNPGAEVRAMELLDAVGVADRAHHTPLELSGGEQQRVALARALINNPAVVLADEPTGNLDAETGDVVLDLLFKLTRASDHALVMVTHNNDIAKKCDRSLYLEKGLLR